MAMTLVDNPRGAPTTVVGMAFFVGPDDASPQILVTACGAPEDKGRPYSTSRQISLVPPGAVTSCQRLNNSPKRPATCGSVVQRVKSCSTVVRFSVSTSH